MADITRLSRLVSGVQRHVDLSANTLVLDNIKLKLGTSFSVTFSGTPTADRTITMPDTNVNLGDIAANTSDIADIRTTQGSSDGDTNIGNYTGTIITDAGTVKAGIQELEVDLDALQTASGIAAEATDLGAFTGTIISDNGTIKAGMQELETDAVALQTLSGSVAESTNHGAFTGATLSDTETTRSALQALETKAEANTALVNGLEWQDSALDFVTDNTAVPATEVTGDRYILSDAGGAPNAAWDGATAGDIVEFNGTTWDATTPTTGMFISADNEDTILYYWGGSAWSTKSFEATTASTGLTKVGFDIRLAAAAENASGIAVSAAGAITLEDLGAFSTTDLSEGTNLYFTDARAIAAPLTGIDLTTNGTVTATDTILEAMGYHNANQLDLTTLTGVAQGATDLGAFTGATISDTLTVKAALQEVETDLEAIKDNTIASTDGSITVSGTVGGDDQVVETTFSTAGTANRSIDAADLASNANALGASMIGIEDSAGNITATTVEGAIAELASAAANTETVSEDMTAGETLTASLRALRMGKTADGGTFTDRVYLASDAAASADDFYVVGIAVTAGELAAATISGVVKAGKMTATAHGFTIGEPIFLSGTTGGLSNTAPSAADEAVVRVGIARDANTIEVGIQVMGIN